jgi:hypothetical protein
VTGAAEDSFGRGRGGEQRTLPPAMGSCLLTTTVRRFGRSELEVVRHRAMLPLALAALGIRVTPLVARADR